MCDADEDVGYDEPDELDEPQEVPNRRDAFEFEACRDVQ
jgi:hypothetical protein